jgi:alpha-tubulin suppressor-like RCC1 family protein
VSAGAAHTCALTTDGTAFCWGSNEYGQLGVAATDTSCVAGDARFDCSSVPVAVSTNLRFTSVSAGQRHTCAITVDRAVYCWGANDQGQSGSGSAGPVLRAVPSVLPWTQISAGYTHSCAVRSDGALFCWGQNDRGQLGTDAVTSSTTPIRVPIGSPVASVSAGQGRSCARTTTGVVYCWGAIWVLRQGGVELTRSETDPQLVPDTPAMSLVSVGSVTTCGTDLDGLAYCWEGNPHGTFGDGTLEGATSAIRVATDMRFASIAAGLAQTCGVTVTGAGYCWGDDTFGQLGLPSSRVVERCGALPCSTTPLPVLGRQSFVEISTGLGSHACGVTTRGNLYCWGLGSVGQRGDGTLGAAVSTPLSVVEPARD